MIRYLLDSTALWRLLRDAGLRSAWLDVIATGAVASCHPQRVEFRRSARTADEYAQMSQMFEELYPDASVPRGIWQWIENAQFRLTPTGVNRALSAVDLLICGTAAGNNLIVLHDDNDFVAAARHLPDLREQRIYSVPPAV